MAILKEAVRREWKEAASRHESRIDYMAGECPSRRYLAPLRRKELDNKRHDDVGLAVLTR